MNEGKGRRFQGESGAALILAIAFMVVIGAISAAVLASAGSGINDRVSLDTLRNREYAADGAVEFAITQVRALGLPGPGRADCGGSGKPNYYGIGNNPPPSLNLNGVATIRVDCSNQPTLTLGGFLQRNVVFTACVDLSTACTDATNIVRAQVSFQAVDSGPVLNVQRTWVQSWSVNG